MVSQLSTHFFLVSFNPVKLIDQSLYVLLYVGYGVKMEFLRAIVVQPRQINFLMKIRSSVERGSSHHSQFIGSCTDR